MILNTDKARQHNPHLPFGDQRTAPWYGKDILSVKQFSRSDLEYIFGVAHEMHLMVDHVGTFDLLKGKILAIYFMNHQRVHLLPLHQPWNAWVEV